jgi:5-hydroxyisourate hydrolase
MSQITTHILDTAKGKPVQGAAIVLYAQENNGWSKIAYGTTNQDGRITDLLAKGTVVQPGIYKMTFATAAYFNSLSVQTFYPYIEIVFEITGPEHYHIPLLVSPFGYSTYRGS